jgi:hypothetical protein
MKDYANRKWATDPHSKEWRDAQIKEFHAKNYGLEPRVGISTIHPRQPVMFQRQYIEG